jgi:hypothetical protein
MDAQTSLSGLFYLSRRISNRAPYPRPAKSLIAENAALTHARQERVDNQQIQINAAASATNDEERSDSLS